MANPDPGYGTNNNNSNEAMMGKYNSIIYGIIEAYNTSKKTKPNMEEEQRNIEIAQNIGEKFVGPRSGRSQTVTTLKDVYDEFDLNEQLLRDIVGSIISMCRDYGDNDMPKNVFIIFVLSMLWAAGGLQGGVLDNEQLYRNIEGDFDYLEKPNVGFQGGKRKTKKSKSKKSKKMKGGKSKKSKSKKSKKNKTRKMKGGKSKKNKNSKKSKSKM